MMDNWIIDFHTHAFPDSLAERAMGKLMAEAPEVRAYLDGRVSSLLGSMDQCGIGQSVLCCIATRPEQFEPIFKWCRQIRSERIIPLPSVHPEDPAAVERVSLIKAEGFKGIKMHPFYQDFYMDDARMYEIYERICQEDLMLTMHTGYDIAFEYIRRADPAKILKVMRDFPGMKLVTTHMGAWQQWDEVMDLLIGREIYMEISFALEYLDKDRASEMINSHPEGYVLFGSDSPWTSQKNTIELLNNLDIGQKRMKEILSDNAERLLGVKKQR